MIVDLFVYFSVKGGGLFAAGTLYGQILSTLQDVFYIYVD